MRLHTLDHMVHNINKLIEFKKEHGLDLDTSICSDFEKNSKNKRG